MGDEIERGAQRGVEAAQIPVVDADQAAIERYRAVEFIAVVDFDEHIEADFGGAIGKLAQLRIGQRRHDEQDAVGAREPRFENLVAVDDEILAQQRQLGAGPRRAQIGEAAAKIRRIGQHRKTRGAGVGVVERVPGGVEIFPDQPFGRRCPLDFRDDRGVGIVDAAGQRFAEAPNRGCIRQFRLELRERPGRPRPGDFAPLVGDDFGENA